MQEAVSQWQFFEQIEINKLTLEKMSRHRIQLLLACNLLSYFVYSFKNVAEGCIQDANTSEAV